jgi:hypothetical protein
MSRTLKDLKSHKKGFGKYGMKKPQRKLTPFIHDANKIAGRNEVLVFAPENDISQEGFDNMYCSDGAHWHNAKTVRALRKQVRAERDYITSQARARIKKHDRKEIEDILGN